ncbi:Acyltransferase 3 [Penicillium expansum]|nr:Acyltransferase 3 [Penicillium expansum]
MNPSAQYGHCRPGDQATCIFTSVPVAGQILVIQGQAWVAIFLVLLGFVNALKPLQLARRGATADALATLSTGAFRRKWRLVFPAALMTILAWLLCQFGAFQLGRRVDAYWLRATSPQQSPSLVAAIVDLIRQIAGTWMYGENAYDQPQWALLPLFRGSLYVFMTLLALLGNPGWYCGYKYFRRHDTSGAIILQSLGLRPHLIFKFLPYGLVTLGLYICSYPDQYADQTEWSSQLASLAEIIFPKDANVSRYYASLGAQMICFWGHAFPPHATDALAPRAIVAGIDQLPAISRPRTANEISDGTPDPESYIPTPGPFRLAIILSMFFVFLLYVVQQWTRYIEPKMGALTAALERFSRSWGKNATWTSKEKDDMLPITSVREVNI